MLYIALVICITIAGLLAWFEKPGWGWFVFLSVILGFIINDMVRM